TLTVNIGELRKERVFDRIPITTSGDQGLGRPEPAFIRVKVFGARSAVDAMTADDVIARVETAGKPKPSDQFTPEVTISSYYSDRVDVRSIEPQKIRIR